MNTSLTEKRGQVRELQAAGRLAEAIQLQIDVINQGVASGQVQAEDFHRLGVVFFAIKDFAAAAQAFESVRRYDPAFPDLSLNLGLCLILTDRFNDAITELRQALQESPDNLNVLDGLSHAYGRVGDIENARAYGEQSLLAKDRMARPAPQKWKLPQKPPPPFRIDRAQENVISFSLFGTQERYLRGAVKNAIVARSLYPGWTCRFHCDETVPPDTRTKLVEAAADVKIMPAPVRQADALFWRFHVADDPVVMRFLVRDCDSVMNIRERRAVDEWLSSDRYFHIMRDSAAHTDLILAGLWGGMTRMLPPLHQLVQGFSYNPITGSRTADQRFLGTVVWPLIKESVLIHDRIFRVFGAKEFPPGADLPPNRHVGDNDAAFR